MTERTCLIDGKLHRLVLVRRSLLDRLLWRQRIAWEPVKPEFNG